MKIVAALNAAASLAQDAGHLCLTLLLVVLLIRNEIEKLSPLARLFALIAGALFAAALIGHIAAKVIGAL